MVVCVLSYTKTETPTICRKANKRDITDHFSSPVMKFIKLKTHFPLWDIRKSQNTDELGFTSILHIILYFLISNEAHWVEKLDRFNREKNKPKPCSAGNWNDHQSQLCFVETIYVLPQWPGKQAK